MKHKRHKRVQRILKFYRVNFGHHPPFQMLIDGTFARACLMKKVNIKDQLPHYLGEELKLLTTRCCLMEMEKLMACAPELFGALQVLKQFPIRECGHGHTEEERKPAFKCIKSMLSDGNPERYFIATQFNELREKARKVPGTPILYLHESAPTLEPPSEGSKQAADDIVHKRIHESHDMKRAQMANKAAAEGTESGKKRKRKAGNPNPLSCLKSKKRKVDPNSNKKSSDEDGAKRKNKRGKRRRKKYANNSSPPEGSS